MQLLIAKGASTVALDAQGRSALQLACLHCGELAVRTLLANGGWISVLGFDCLLTACLVNKPACLSLLLEHTVGGTSSNSSSSSSSSSATTDINRPIVTAGGYTALHAAAAWGRLQCVGMLLRYGYAAGALCITGASPAALAAASSVPAQLRREGLVRSVEADRQAVVLLLLRSGCPIQMYSGAVQQFVRELQQQLVMQVQAVRVLANSAYCGSGDDAVSASSASSSAVATAANANANATAAARQHIVRVQLVHASTGQRAHQVYTIDTTLLAALHTQRGETGVSVLANMLVAPSGWGAAATTATVSESTTAGTVKYLQYDDDVDFSELGFECVLQYYYTAIIQGATYGMVDTDRLQATLQAAQFFGLDKLAAAAKEFAKASGVIVQ
jgi:Ankyrin repeats (3 copies)